jgi:hypothetical protein
MKSTTIYIGEISIEQVLAEISANTGKPFWLEFVRSSGNDAGKIKVVGKALYGRSEQVTKMSPKSVIPRKASLHIHKGTLPMQDYTEGHYISPLISHIIGYNLKKVKH